MTLNRSFLSLAAAFLAMSAAAISAVVALTVQSVGSTPTIIAAVSGLLAAVLLYRQSKHDLDAVLTLVAVFALITAICTGLYLYWAHEPGMVPKATVLVAALTGMGLVFLTYRRQRAEAADFPDVLGRRFGRAGVVETDGIQFAGTLQPGEGRSPHLVTIFLQNTFDGPRTVTIRFDAAGAEKYLRFYPRHELTLGPAAVSAVTLPVIAPKYPGSYPLYFSLQVTGSKGRRVRLHRARTATTRVKASTTVALLAVGHLAVGGGVRFTIGPLPEDIWTATLPAPTVESLWQPKIGTVPLDPSGRV